MKYYLFLVMFLSFVILSGCGKKDSTSSNNSQPAPPPNSSIKVLILEDEGTQDEVFTTLANEGFAVEFGGEYWEADGSNFMEYDLIIFLNGVEYTYEMADSVQYKLRNFVRDGGVLLTTEWITYTSSRYQIVQEFLPVTYMGNYEYDTEIYQKEIDHPVTSGLPNSFVLQGDWTYCETELYDNSLSTNRQVLIKGSESGAALSIGDLGQGKAIHWNMAGQYDGDDIWTDEVRQILINIAKFSKSI